VSLQSRAERVYTCFYMYQELGMYLRVLVCIILCEPVSRAEHECACLSASGDSVMNLHVLTRIESWACICVCFHDSRAWYARAGFSMQHVLARVGPSRKLSMYLHLLAFIQSSVVVVFCIEGFACVCMCVHLGHISMRLGWSCHISACACKNQGLWMYPEVHKS
jgi:hypothetical protein